MYNIWNMYLLEHGLTIAYHENTLLIQTQSESAPLFVRIDLPMPEQERHAFDYLVGLADLLEWSPSVNTLLGKYIGTKAIADLHDIVEVMDGQ